MTVNPLLSSSISAVQQIVSSALKNVTSLTNSNTNSVAGIATPQDSNQLSPFAQVMSELQQLQQQNPAQYQQVTAQISKNLTAAAQTATSQGNTAQANQLNQLATDFQTASSSGQLPSVQDLAQAVGGGGHHHHHHHAPSSSSDSSTDTSAQSQTQSLFSTGSSNTQNQDALSIILNTLASPTSS